MSLYVFVLVLLTIHACSTTTHTDCPNQPSFPRVSIEGCSEQPCQLKTGTTVKFDLDINVRGNVTDLKVNILAFAMGATVNYPLPNDDVCSGLINGECPLDDGELVTYELLFPILTSFPAVPCIVTVTIVSEQGTQGCTTIALEVVH